MTGDSGSERGQGIKHDSQVSGLSKLIGCYLQKWGKLEKKKICGVGRIKSFIIKMIYLR